MLAQGRRPPCDPGHTRRVSRYHRKVPSPSVEAFLASLKRCLAAPGFLEAFYARFTDSSEEVREKFRGTDMKRQARVLEDSLYVVANAVQGEEGSLARGALPALAARHGRQGLDIRPGLYDLWIDCIVETARAHDPQFDPAIERAWRETLVFGADYMRQRY
jgi:hemoglobin-like flavoprotein